MIVALFEAAERRQCLIDIDPDMAPSLIGKKGATIRALESEFGCRININRGEGQVRLRGDEEKLAAAKARIEEMKQEYAEQAAAREKETCSIPIEDPDHIPLIIGSKGATIRRIQDESGCNRIDINRDAMTVTIRGPEETVEKAKEILEALFEERRAEKEEYQKKQDERRT